MEKIEEEPIIINNEKNEEEPEFKKVKKIEKVKKTIVYTNENGYLGEK